MLLAFADALRQVENDLEERAQNLLDTTRLTLLPMRIRPLLAAAEACTQPAAVAVAAQYVHRRGDESNRWVLLGSVVVVSYRPAETGVGPLLNTLALALCRQAAVENDRHALRYFVLQQLFVGVSWIATK